MSAHRGRRARFILPALSVVCLASPSVATADDRPDFVIAILGDSYAAGEGSPDKEGRHDVGGGFSLCLPLDGPADDPNNPDDCHEDVWWAESSPVTFPQGDDAGWVEETTRCHRSSRATGPQAAMRIQERFPDVEIVVLHFACSGAEIAEGMLEPDDGTEAALLTRPRMKPQLQALEDYVAGTSRKIDAIVMDIGGNDAFFGAVLEACLFGVTDCSDSQDIRQKVAGRLAAGSGTGDPLAATVADRFLTLARAIDGTGPASLPRLFAGRPAEVYHTSVPNPARDENGVLCDGSQTSDVPYRFISQPEAVFVEAVSAGMNAAFAAASAAHGWIFAGGNAAASTNHGICADAASWFRTNGEALRVQGQDVALGVLPFNFAVARLPFVSSGIGHPNPTGYRQMGTVVADTVEEQVRMRFRAANLTLGGVTPQQSFFVQWTDPSPLHAPETRWEMELAEPGRATARLFSDGSPAVNGTLQINGSTRTWTVRRTGDFTVRVRGCRPASYCGPFSNAVLATTTRAGAPTNVQRLANSALLRNRSIAIAWTAAAGTPASARYEVRFERRAEFCGNVINGQTACILNGFVDGGTQSVITTSFRLGTVTAPLDPADTWSFQVRTCTTAGCSDFSPRTLIPVQESLSRVGLISLRGPASVRAGRVASLEVTWRAPRRWTDLRHIDIDVLDGTRRVGRVRFTQESGLLTLDGSGPAVSGYGDEQRTLTSGALGLDLERSSVVRFGPRSKQVALRLGLVPARSLRGHVLTLRIGGRNDRGTVQRAQIAGLLRVRG